MLPVDDRGDARTSSSSTSSPRAANVKVVATELRLERARRRSTTSPKIAAWAHEHGAIHVCDAAQAAPHKRVDVQALGTDFVAV